MPRLEIELDERSFEELQELAITSGRSLSGTVRDLLQSALMLKGKPPAYKLSDFTFIAARRSGQPGRASEDHDQILGESRWTSFI